jgi:hypothetical protein
LRALAALYTHTPPPPQLVNHPTQMAYDFCNDWPILLNARSPVVSAMQTLTVSLAQEPLDPVFALASSSIPSALKICLVIVLSFLLLVAPLSLFIRCLQDSSIALGHHNPNNRIPYWFSLTPLLLIAAVSAVYLYFRATKVLPSSLNRSQWRIYVSALGPCVEMLAAAVSLVAAILKLQVLPA